MVEQLLTWVLTGTSKNSRDISLRQQPATLYGYRRVPIHDADEPALILGDAFDQVEGFLVHITARKELRKLDDFEDEAFAVKRSW